MTYKTYNQYIDTEIEWLGSIPSSWKLLKSKFLFNRVNNRSTTGNEELLSVSEYYGIKPKREIDKGDFLSRSESLVGYKKCSKNDLVMNIMLAWKKGLGVTNYDGIVSPAYEIFNINLQLAYPRYMNYLLRTDLYASEFRRHSYGVIDSRLRLYPDNFKEIECILPPIDEQKQISNYLDKKIVKIDATIEKSKELIELLEEKRVALINQVVTKGLTPNVPMKDSGIEWIGEIPADWDIIRTKFCLSIDYGHYFKSDDFVNDGVNLIRIGNIVEGTVELDNCVKLPLEYYSLFKEHIIKSNDLLIALTGATIGKIGIVPKTSKLMLMNYRVGKINCDAPDYYKYILNSYFIQKQIKLISDGSAQENISYGDIANFVILNVDDSTKKQIANYLDKKTSEIDETISKIQKNINLLEEYKTSLIHHVVTGKIDVRGEKI